MNKKINVANYGVHLDDGGRRQFCIKAIIVSSLVGLNLFMLLFAKSIGQNKLVSPTIPIRMDTGHIIIGLTGPESDRNLTGSNCCLLPKSWSKRNFGRMC